MASSTHCEKEPDSAKSISAERTASLASFSDTVELDVHNLVSAVPEP
jgi:hypothetical protein